MVSTNKNPTYEGFLRGSGLGLCSTRIWQKKTGDEQPVGQVERGGSQCSTEVLARRTGSWTDSPSFTNMVVFTNAANGLTLQSHPLTSLVTNPGETRMKLRYRFNLVLGLLLAVCFSPTLVRGQKSETELWIQLFNGKDLEGWTPKIRYHALGENYGNTFRVEDGLLKVRYDEAAYPKFGEKFGHLFFKQPFSNYRLRVEYRFVGEQCPGGPGWAIRNSGMMLHGEDPKLMTVDQDFPTSIEAQILGGNGTSERTTMNLCTPGTNVVLNGKLFLPHCTSSTSPTYHGEQWVMVEMEVHGSGIIKHIIDGKTVLEYSQPQLDERDEHAKMLAERQGGLLLAGGYISLQSESHPIDFRKVELMVLDE